MRILLLTLLLSFSASAANCSYQFKSYLVDFGDYYAGSTITSDFSKETQVIIDAATQKNYQLQNDQNADYLFVIFEQQDPTEPHFLILKNDKALSQEENIANAFSYLVKAVNEDASMPEAVIYYSSFVKYNPFASMSKKYSKYFSDFPDC